MSFAENLLQGLDRAAGATDAAADIQERKDRRTALADEERAGNLDLYNQAISGIQTRMGTLDPNSAEYHTLQDSLGKVIRSRTALFHPSQGQTPLGWFAQKIHLKKPTAAPAPGPGLSPAAAVAAGTPRGSDVPSKFDDVMKAYHAVFGKDMTPDEKKAFFNHLYGGAPLEPKPEAENWQTHDIILADGKKVSAQYNTKTGKWRDLAGNDIPPEQLQGAKVAPKEKPPTSTEVTMEAYENAFDPPVKWAQMSPEQKAFFPRWQAMQRQAETTGQNVMLVPQLDGSIKPIVVQRSSQKSYPGTTPPGMRTGKGKSSAAPKTAGEAKKSLKGAGVVSTGDVVGNRRTPAMNKADDDVREATKLSSIADQVAQHPNDAVNQKRLAVALERASAGRFTTQALDYIIKAGWANTIEQWANNPSTGALPSDVLRQLVDGAHENLKAAQDAQATAYAGVETPGGKTGGADSDVDDIVKALKNPPPKKP